MVYLRGDGEWLALFRCQGKWQYSLHADQIDAISAAKKSCGPSCIGSGNHKTWKLLDDCVRAARQTTAKLPAEPKQNSELMTTVEQTSFWEQRLGIDGLD